MRAGGQPLVFGIFVLSPGTSGHASSASMMPSLSRSGRAAVGLGVVGLDARHVGAGVFVIEDAVLVAIGRAAVGLGVVGLDAGDVGARVLGIDDAVLVAIRGGGGQPLVFGSSV